MAAIRQAVVTWNGDLASGQGLVSASSSKAFTSLPVSWAARTQSTEGRTSPEELVAAAHASCFSMALSAGLGRGGTPPQKLEVEATITFDQAGGSWTVVSSALKDGKVRSVMIQSEKGRDCTVQNPWPGKSVTLCRNGKKAETLKGDRFTFKTAKGERITLAP